ncbi:MAG: SRPBCC domain-containing protein [Actinobacteria bacterium]|nr:SRPBCC domain-containing protein [Actinomycetota bacterium]
MDREIMFAVDIAADPKAVYEAVSTEEGLKSFWTPNSTATTEEGSVARFEFGEGAIKMRIDRLDPGAEVRWTCVGDFPFWNDTVVAWRMAPNPDGPGTRLTFSHTGWPEDQPEHAYASVSYTWGQIVADCTTCSSPAVRIRTCAELSSPAGTSSTRGTGG